jgi:hypothetical protein
MKHIGVMRIFAIIGLVFLTIMMIVSVIDIFLMAKHKEIKETGQLVNAVFTDCRYDGPVHSQSSDHWQLRYYYKADNGIEYSGILEVNGEARAKGLLGTEVSIYVDGKGNCVYSGEEPSPLHAGIVALAFAAADGLVLYFGILRRKKEQVNRIETKRLLG